MWGGEANKRAALLTNPLFPIQSAVLHCGDRDRERASSLSETNKTTVREAERGTPRFLVAHTIKLHRGAGKHQEKHGSHGAVVGFVGISQLTFAFPRVMTDLKSVSVLAIDVKAGLRLQEGSITHTRGETSDFLLCSQTYSHTTGYLLIL